MYGAVADPQKSAWTVIVRDILASCTLDGSCLPSDPAIANATRFLLKNVEHTFGHDTKSLPADYIHYTNEALHQMLASGNAKFAGAVASWVEQRAYGFDYALEALDQAHHPLAARLRSAFADIVPPRSGPDFSGFRRIVPGTVYDGGRLRLSFDAESGAVASLVDASTGAVYAGAADGVDGNGTLLALEYYTYSNDVDYLAFFEAYSTANMPPFPGPGNFFPDFTKQNTSANALDVHQRVPATLQALFVKDGGGTATFLAQLTFGDPSSARGPHLYWGAPEEAWLELSMPLLPALSTGPVVLNATLISYNKTATRLSEGLFLRLNMTRGVVGQREQLRLDKVGAWIDPYDVVLGGCHKQHAVGPRGIELVSTQAAGVRAQLAMASRSAMLVNIATPNILPYPVNATAFVHGEGVQWLLSNNGWATNYPLWSPFLAGDESQQWRFELTLSS